MIKFVKGKIYDKFLIFKELLGHLSLNSRLLRRVYLLQCLK